MLDLVENGAALGRDRINCARRSKRPARRIINTGIGWHEARIPTIVTRVPRAAFAWVTAQAEEATSVCRWSRPTASTCPTWPRRCSADGDADMVSMARPFLADPEWVNKARASRVGRHQHLHRLQPGLPGPRVREQARQLPGQSARLQRDRAGFHACTNARSIRRRRRRAGRARRCHHSWPSAAMRHPVRCGRRRSAASSTWPSAFRARRSSTRRCAISAIAWTTRRETASRYHGRRSSR